MSRLGLIAGLVMVPLLVIVGLSRGSKAPVNPNLPQSGLASWYGKEEHGKLTANGETFDRRAMTAAHRGLPFNSIVRVTNVENGRSVTVRINDRGPYRGKRILDVSEAAADSLGMRKSGVVPVRIEAVDPATSVSPPSLP